MGFKAKATKANKAKKQDRAPIKREASGQKFGGMATHKHITEWSGTGKSGGRKTLTGRSDLGFDKSVETGVMVEGVETKRRFK